MAEDTYGVLAPFESDIVPPTERMLPRGSAFAAAATIQAVSVRVRSSFAGMATGSA